MSYVAENTRMGKSETFNGLYRNVLMACRNRAEKGYYFMPRKELKEILANYPCEVDDKVVETLKADGYTVTDLWVNWSPTT